MVKAGEIVVVNDVYENKAIVHNYEEAEICTCDILRQVVSHNFISDDEASNIFNDVLLYDRAIFEKPLDDKDIRDLMWRNLFGFFFDHVGHMVTEERNNR